MHARISYFLGLVLGVAFTCGAAAQTSEMNMAIVEAWMKSGHADADAEAFRHWDDEGEIPGDCAVCHSTTGVVEFLSTPQQTAGVIDHPVPIGTTIECEACHNPGAEDLSAVVFPNGQAISVADGSAICSVCHQGRTSMADVDDVVEGIGADDVSDQIRFVNIHYAAAATTQQGSAVRGGYQYPGKSYAGPFEHVPGLNSCVACHDSHETVVKLENCTSCHAGISAFADIRTTPLDILGRGETGNGIGTVVDELKIRLQEAIMLYAREKAGMAVVYADASYPYFFIDTNENGSVDVGEAAFPNRYASWTPRLLRAAYNYQFVNKDKGAFAHNPHYVIQLLIDSIEDLASVAPVDTTGLMRP